MKVAIIAVLLTPAAALAASAFDGTWKANLDSLKTSGKPDVIVLADGEYSCRSCFPPLEVKADGVEHKVSGHAYYDTVTVQVLSPTSVETTLKQGGKVYATITDTVSADGQTLTTKFVNHGGAKAVTGESTAKRVANGPAGAHAISGSWQQNQLQGSELMRTVHYQMTDDGFTYRWNGQSYDAKFDGKEYPIAGDPGHTSVTLKKIDPNTVEETDHRQGKVVDVTRLAAAPDGKTIAVTDNDLAHGQTTTYTLDKQQ
jgi:hypothetical protein